MTEYNIFGALGQSTLPGLLSQIDPAKSQALTANLFQAAQEAQSLFVESLARSGTGLASVERHDPFGAFDAQLKLGTALARHPDKIGHAMMTMMQGWTNLFQSMVQGAPAPRDRRFSDPEWSANPLFDFMRRAWQLNADWLNDLVDAAEADLEREDYLKAKFFINQWIDATAPSNFLATNPAALRAMIETGGESLVQGFRNLREDLKRGHGRLHISQSDEDAFRLGENVATAEGQVIYRNKLIEVIHYAPARDTVYSRPMLIFPPWINKFYILDLQPENSMIRWLLSQGVNTFLVSWRSADSETKHFRWDDYVERGVMAAVDAVTAETGSADLNAIGYCIGGTLLTSALGHMARTGDARIHSATYFASQSDFENAGELKVFTTDQAIDYLHDIVDQHNGYMPGELMGETFNWLRPGDLVWRYVVDNYMLGKTPKPFDLLYWNADQTNIPGPTHKTYLQDLYHDNCLARGTFEVFGEPVSMGDITIPVYVQASRSDHICPWQSIYRGAQNYGGDVTFTLAGSGHIAGVINPPGSGKYQHWLNPDLPDAPDDWLAHAREVEGSWWPSWWEWLEPLSGEPVDASDPVDYGLGAAPGQYARMRLADIAAGKKPAGPYSDQVRRPAAMIAEATRGAERAKKAQPAKKTAKKKASGKGKAAARPATSKTKSTSKAATKSTSKAKSAPKSKSAAKGKSKTRRSGRSGKKGA